MERRNKTYLISIRQRFSDYIKNKMDAIAYFFTKNKFSFFAFLVLLIPIGVYIINFGSHEFSDDPAMWGVFGDYIGGVYNVLVAILVVYISHNLDKKEERQNKKTKAAYDIKVQIEKFETSGNRPKTVERLTNLILSNKEVLGSPTYRMLLSLNDHFQHVITDNIPINMQQKNDAIDDLISIYED